MTQILNFHQLHIPFPDFSNDMDEIVRDINEIYDYYNHRFGSFPCVVKNGSELCLKDCRSENDEYSYNNYLDKCVNLERCIPVSKVCDGVLDFIGNLTYYEDLKDNKGCKGYRPYNLREFSDELFCGQRNLGVFISIFGAAGIAIILCFTTLVLTFESIVIILKLVIEKLKRICNTHERLSSSSL